LNVHAFYGDQIAGHLGSTFPEANVVVVHGELVGVVGQGIHTCGRHEISGFYKNCEERNLLA
jgi:hypothetical protein